MANSTFGQILGGVVGAVVGWFAGGPGGAVKGALYGAGVGYGVGGIIDPPNVPTIAPTKLDDTSFQSDIMGSTIPWLNGTISRSGRVMWFEGGKLKNRLEKKKSGGKGGDGEVQETVKYTATFGVQLGLASPGATIRKIWIGGHLYYDAEIPTGITAPTTGMTFPQLFYWTAVVAQRRDQSREGAFVFYDGTQTDPDPRMEAEIGAGITPNYRGEMMIFFYDLDSTDYGPSLAAMPVKVEFVEAEDYTPDNVFTSAVEVSADHSADFDVIPQYVDEQDGAIYLLPHWGASVPSSSTYDYIRFRADGRTYVTENISYAPVGGTTPTLNGAAKKQNFSEALNAHFYMFGAGDLPGTTNAPTSSDNHYVNSSRAAINGSGTSVKYLAEGSNSWIDVDTSTLLDGNPHAVTLDESGNMFIVMDTRIYKLSPDESVLAVRSHSVDGFGSLNSTAFGTTFVAVDSGVCIMVNLATDPNKIMTFPDDLTRVMAFSQTLPLKHTDSHYTCPFFRLGILYILSTMNSAKNEYEIDAWNVLTLGDSRKDLQTLTEAIASRVGVTLDSTALAGITVRGMRIDDGTPNALSALSALQTAFAFDIVQDGYSFKSVLRSSLSSSVTIEYDDLGAGMNSPAESRISYTRKRSIDLPYKVEVRYMDYIRDYDFGMQSDQFPTDSKKVTKVDLPIAMSATEAKNVATTLVNTAHIEQESHELSLPQKFLGIGLSDVITVETPGRDYILRAHSRNETADQLLQLSCKVHEATTFDPQSLSDDGRINYFPLKYVLSAKLVIIDAPMMGISDGDTYGMSYAMWSLTPNWAGGVLFQSSDSGQTYKSISNTDAGTEIALCVTTLSADEGYVIDYTSTLNFFMENGEFESVTVDAMLGGANYFLYGIAGRWEVIQIANFTDESNGSITADTFIRGCFGTEWASGLHEADDYLIYVSIADTNIVGLQADTLNVERLYKAVSFSLNLEDQTAISHTYTGVNLKPLSPVNVAGTVDGSDNWDIVADERSRYANTLWNVGVVSTAEPSAEYKCEIYTDNTYATLQRTLTSSSGFVFEYTSADQVTDFGVNQSDLNVRLYMVSARVGDGYKTSKTLTS